MSGRADRGPTEHPGTGESHGGVADIYDAATRSYVSRIGTRIDPTIEADEDIVALDDLARAIGPSIGPVLDAGCGPGRVAAHLAGRSIAAVGVDISSGMVLAARDAHPGIPFLRADLDHLPFPDGSFAGVVAWYSIIHEQPGRLLVVAQELARVLRSGGQVLVAFQAGDGSARHHTDAYGTGRPLTSYRHDPDRVRDVLGSAGLETSALTVRPPRLDHEATAQAILRAHR